MWETQQDAPAELSTDTELVRSARLTSSTAAGVCLCGEWGGDPGMAGGSGWAGLGQQPAQDTGTAHAAGQASHRAVWAPELDPNPGKDWRSLSLGVMQIGLLN